MRNANGRGEKTREMLILFMFPLFATLRFNPVLPILLRGERLREGRLFILEAVYSIKFALDYFILIHHTSYTQLLLLLNKESNLQSYLKIIYSGECSHLVTTGVTLVERTVRHWKLPLLV